DFVGYLLDKGADPNALLNGRPPLFEVIVDTGQSANQKTREEAPMLVSLLMAHGARPDDVGLDVLPHDTSTPAKLIKATPLFFFAANGDAPCVKLLLAHGADPRKKASNGQTPLDVAVDPCKELLLQAIRAK
nr:ankyrin repeat domain-containing protein [Fimbriimonadaceae bacterium]